MGMMIEEIKAYLKSMLSSYHNSTDTSNSNPKYRKICVSENDAEALNTAIDIMRKYQKIEQILKDIPYGGEATVRRIQEVVEDGKS